MEYESYVNLETAKLLKKAGFKIGCDSFYGLDVRHNGESIGEDEEYELKARGRKSEIEYVQGGRVYSGFYHSNKKGEDYNGYSRPTLAVAQKWLGNEKSVDAWVTVESVLSNKTDVYEKKYAAWVFDNKHDYNLEDDTKYCGIYNTYDEALEAGIVEGCKNEIYK